MRQVFEQILKMPYYKNYAAASGKVHNVANHEQAVEDILNLEGFQKVDRKVTKAARDEWIQGATNDMENNTFVAQPCGTHNSPDFIIKHQDRLYFVECKSAAGSTSAPMYNSGIPNPGYIYVFSAQKYNGTTIYRGDDILPPAQYQRLKAHIENARRLDEELSLNNSHGIGYYTRPMVTHAGGRRVTDYFTHPRRDELERRVLDSV